MQMEKLKQRWMESWPNMSKKQENWLSEGKIMQIFPSLKKKSYISKIQRVNFLPDYFHFP